MENKIIKIERNEDDLHYPFVTFSNGKTTKIYIKVITTLLGEELKKLGFCSSITDVKLPFEFENEQLLDAYRKGYEKEVAYINSIIKGDYSKYKKLTYGQKGIYSELLQAGVLK